MKKTTISLATSAVLATGMALSPTLASADVSPFETAELSSGYMQVAEGNCGGDMPKTGEAKCGAEMKEKMAEGKCGEAKCGAEMKEKMGEGKCGEAKCGASKVDADFLANNSSYVAAMGAMKAANEGKCGEGKCGGDK